MTGIAGAALGAGIGFFASQIAQGDWDEERGTNRVDRSTWAAVGGASGLVLGFSIPIGGRASAGEPGFPGGDRFMITREQIQEASVRNALEAVQLFHPEWLVVRGQEAVLRPEHDDIRVYMDNVQMGTVPELAGVTSMIIESIRFWDATRATARWGTGHTHGAIQIVTMG